jgi:mRNA interferase HigB
LKILAKKILRDFWESNPEVEDQLKSWYQEAFKSSWPNPNYVKDEFPNSRLIPNNRVIFNIKGNQYRLIVRVNYKYQMIYVRFIGTHEDYDKIDPTKI